MTEQQNVKPLTQAQQGHLEMLNLAFLRAKQNMDAFIAYLRAEHEAPAPEWILRDPTVGFEMTPRPPVEGNDQRRRGRKRQKPEEVVPSS